MRLTENKVLMIALMLVMIISSSFLSGISQLNTKANAIVKEFNVGEKKDGLSIQRDLDTRVTCAKNMITLAKQYLPVTTTEIVESEKSVVALENAKSIADKYKCNQNLQVNLNSVWALLADKAMSEQHTKSAKEQMSIFNNAQNTISYDPYNTLVSKYEEETTGIIASFMKVFAKKVEYFR